MLIPIHFLNRAAINFRLCLIGCYCVTSFLSAGAEEPPEPLKPKVAAASAEAGEAMQGFKIPAGWKANLFAAEPDVANIVAFSIDHQGRGWICETFRQSAGVTDNRSHDENWLKADLAAQSVADRIAFHRELLGEKGVQQYQEQDDRIRLVEDTDGDGQVDQSQVFASGFNRLEEGTGAGVLHHRGSVYYTCIPKLWRLLDRDQDGQADERIVLSDGYGVRVAFRGHDMHGLIVGPDGRLYFSIGDRGYNIETAEGTHFHDPASGAVFRCELDGTKLEVFATGLRNPQELAFDKFGNLFTGDNNSDSGDRARWVYVVQGGDTGWRMYYQYLPDRGPFNREKIWHPMHAEQPAYIVPPIENVSDGPSGLAYYPGTGLGDAWENTFFLADFRGTPNQSGIRALKVEPQGAFFKLASNEQTVWKVLATDITFGPEGAMYVSDWVDGWVGEGKGRIYRFQDPEQAAAPIVQEVKKLLGGNWQTATPDQLALWLKHADQRVRLESQWELAHRDDVTPLVNQALDGKSDAISRLHGIWGCGHWSRLHPDRSGDALEPLVKLLDDSEPLVRAAAANTLGDVRYQIAASKLVALVSDEEPRVAAFAALALGRLHAPEALEPIIQLLADNNGADPIIRHAGIVALQNIASDTETELVGLRWNSSAAVRRAATVALRRRHSPQIAAYLEDQDRLVVAEAARAIHDVPLQEAFPNLAALLARKDIDEESALRSLNANYRLGTLEHALTVASYAANEQAPARLRKIAIEMLSRWSEPDPRDWVTNQWLPLPSRSADLAVAALKKHLPFMLAGPEEVKQAAIEVAAKFGIADVIPELTKQITGDAAANLRASALLALVKLDPDQAKVLSEQLLTAKEPELRVASINAIATLAPQRAVGLLVEKTQSQVPRERQNAWSQLSRFRDAKEVREAIDRGMNAYLDESLPQDVWLDLLTTAAGRLPEILANRLKEQEAAWTKSDPLAAWRWALAGGDPEAGRAIFFYKTEVSCVRCHKVGKIGGEVGPDLTAPTMKRDPRYLLEAIALPNATIAKGFESVVLVDDSGTVHNGILKGETDEYVELVTVEGTTKRIDKDTIEARRKGNSAMPADLVKQLSPTELRDLVAYLVSLRSDAADKTKHE